MYSKERMEFWKNEMESYVKDSMTNGAGERLDEVWDTILSILDTDKFGIERKLLCLDRLFGLDLGDSLRFFGVRGRHNNTSAGITERLCRSFLYDYFHSLPQSDGGEYQVYAERINAPAYGFYIP